MLLATAFVLRYQFFTFQSGYIQINIKSSMPAIAYLFTFQSGYIQINVRVCVVCVLIVLYIPIWLYSNGQLKKVLYHLALHSNLVIFKLNCST